MPGEDALLALKRKIEQHSLQAAFIASSVGSLTHVALRFAGQENTFHTTGKFEIVSLIGTLDANGEHLHLSVSDEEGKVLGGHMMPGCTVRTTLELIIGNLKKLISLVNLALCLVMKSLSSLLANFIIPLL